MRATSRNDFSSFLGGDHCGRMDLRPWSWQWTDQTKPWVPKATSGPEGRHHEGAHGECRGGRSRAQRGQASRGSHRTATWRGRSAGRQGRKDLPCTVTLCTREAARPPPGLWPHPAQRPCGGGLCPSPANRRRGPEPGPEPRAGWLHVRPPPSAVGCGPLPELAPEPHQRAAQSAAHVACHGPWRETRGASGTGCGDGGARRGGQAPASVGVGLAEGK